MGIDVSFSYGIGYEVDFGETDVDGDPYEEETLDEGIHEYVYEVIGEGFATFGENDGYDTPITSAYIIKENPLDNGLDLTETKLLVEEEIKRLGLEPIGEFGVVGGMVTY